MSVVLGIKDKVEYNLKKLDLKDLYYFDLKNINRVTLLALINSKIKEENIEALKFLITNRELGNSVPLGRVLGFYTSSNVEEKLVISIFLN